MAAGSAADMPRRRRGDPAACAPAWRRMPRGPALPGSVDPADDEGAELEGEGDLVGRAVPIDREAAGEIELAVGAGQVVDAATLGVWLASEGEAGRVEAEAHVGHDLHRVDGAR